MADDFERAHLEGSGKVFGRAKIPVPRYLLLAAVAGPVAAAGMLIGVAGWPVLTALGIAGGMGAIGFFGNLALMGVRTVVSEGGIDVSVGVRSALHLGLEEIADVEVIDIRARDVLLGRGQVRSGPRGKVYGYDLGVKRGVRIRTTGGRSLVLGAHDPEALADAIARALAHAGRSEVRVRVEAEPEPERAELEVDGARAERTEEREAER